MTPAQTCTFTPTFPLWKLGWKSLEHLWAAHQLGKKSEPKGTSHGKQLWSKQGNTHPESVTCSFPGSPSQSQALTPTLVPAAGMKPYFSSKLQGTSSTNNFCSDKAAGPGEAADTSLKMSSFWLPLKNKNALKQQVIPNHWDKFSMLKKTNYLSVQQENSIITQH